MMAVRKKLILRNTVKENALINVKLWNYKVSKELMENVSIFTLFEKSQDWGQNDCLTFSYIKRLLQIIQRNVIEFNFKRRRREAFYEACIWIFSDFRIILSVWFYPLFSIEEWRNLSFQLNFWFIKWVAKFQFLRPKYYNFYTQNLKIWRKAKNSWTFSYILTM